MIKIIKANLKNIIHQDAIFNLLNTYINDIMGGGIPHKQTLKTKLINGLIEANNSLVYLAKYNDKYIGMAICFISFSTFKLKKIINIHDLIVLPEYRNRHIGRKLMCHIISIAKKTGCGKLTLEVRQDNANAKHLYKSLGFNDCDPPMLFWVKYI